MSEKPDTIVQRMQRIYCDYSIGHNLITGFTLHGEPARQWEKVQAEWKEAELRNLHTFRGIPVYTVVFSDPPKGNCIELKVEVNWNEPTEAADGPQEGNECSPPVSG